MTLGAVSGGILMKIGRRNAILIASCIGIIGVFVSSHLNMVCLLTGRFIFGYSVGLYSSVCPRFIEETVPIHYYDRIIPTFNFSQSIGALSAYLIGSILPSDKDPAALFTTDKWKYIYFYFPVSLYCLTLLSFTFVIKNDSIKFLTV